MDKPQKLHPDLRRFEPTPEEAGQIESHYASIRGKSERRYSREKFEKDVIGVIRSGYAENLLEAAALLDRTYWRKET